MSTQTKVPPSLQYYADDRSLSFCDHWIYRNDGAGGRTAHPAKFRFLPQHRDQMVYPWSLARMDNGEVVVAGVACNMSQWKDYPRQPVLAFSKDQGATWSEYVEVEGCESRPMMLAYLGNGELSFMTSFEAENCRLYSRDYGRTWTEKAALDTAPDGLQVSSEGNSLVEVDDNGVAVALAETGQTMRQQPEGHWLCRGCIRWSRDGGRSWDRCDFPDIWRWEDLHDGKPHDRGVGEGALVRAANGWIVAALRTDMPARFIAMGLDNFEGTAVSISKDNGETWSPLQFVFGLGRHHATLVRLPNDDLVMTCIRRLDLHNDKLGTYRRGCDAVISHDNGLTWEADRPYVLDEFSAIGTPRDYGSHPSWYRTVCGHQFSIGMGDGQILTTYGNYRNAGALILWKPF